MGEVCSDWNPAEAWGEYTAAGSSHNTALAIEYPNCTDRSAEKICKEEHKSKIRQVEEEQNMVVIVDI